MNTVKMVEVTRNGAVESVHQGTAILINSSDKSKAFATPSL